MNQILSVEQPKKAKKQKVNNSYNSYNGRGQIEVNKIVKFFAIVLIVFGIIMVSSGSYSIYNDTQIGNTQAKPTISVNEISETQLEIEVTQDTPLEKVTYNWNSENQVELDVNGEKSIKETIEIPSGENTLNIYASDKNGRETNYSRLYTRQGDITINEFEVEGNNIKVTANGKNQLSYMTYRWDEEEEQRIDINSMSTEQLIEIPIGQHTLTVSVVDINNNTETKQKEVKGITIPKVEITTDGSSNFLVRAEDTSGIKKIEIIFNGGTPQVIDVESNVQNLEDRKRVEFKYPIQNGENRLEVTVYNETGETAVERVKATK